MFHKQCSISEPICFAQYKLLLPYMAGPVYRYSPATQYLKVRLAWFIGIGQNDLNGFGHRRALDNGLHPIYLIAVKSKHILPGKILPGLFEDKARLVYFTHISWFDRVGWTFQCQKLPKKILEKSGDVSITSPWTFQHQKMPKKFLKKSGDVSITSSDLLSWIIPNSHFSL